ncbi:MAG: TetR/AcrR family transcriptional regulator [Myxococcales bacterium]|nr:TetR/AcrR family transcriptional regulator [Myxococcales bacterium]
MKRARTGYHHGDLRNALVEAALKRLQESGLEDFSLREVARIVGVSPNAAYRHYANKSALLTAVAGDGFVRLGQRIQRAQAAGARGASATEIAMGRFRSAGRAYVEFAAEHRVLFSVMQGEYGLRALVPVEGQEAPASPLEALSAALDALVEAGALPNTAREGGAIKVWSLLHGFAILSGEDGPVEGTRAERTRLLEGVIDLALDGLRGGAASA